MADERKKKVLIVEDDAEIVDIIKLTLENEGFETVKARDGLEGVDKAKAEKPDCIILDVLMPKQDGLTTFGDLQADAGTKDIPVIMLTSVHERLGFGVSPDEMETLYGRKPDAYFEKPFKPKKMIETIRRLTGEPAG